MININTELRKKSFLSQTSNILTEFMNFWLKPDFGWILMSNNYQLFHFIEY